MLVFRKGRCFLPLLCHFKINYPSVTMKLSGSMKHSVETSCNIKIHFYIIHYIVNKCLNSKLIFKHVHFPQTDSFWVDIRLQNSAGVWRIFWKGPCSASQSLWTVHLEVLSNLIWCHHAAYAPASLGGLFFLFWRFRQNTDFRRSYRIFGQWILVLVIGGRDYTTPKRRQGLYLVYKRYFSCQLGDYILPITLQVRTWNIHWLGNGTGRCKSDENLW